MKTKIVIDDRNLPRKAPISITLILVIGLKAFSAPQWAIGGVGAVIILLWVLFIRDAIKYKEQSVNIFRNKQNS